MVKRPLRDVDSEARMRLFKAAGWASSVGVFMGLGVGLASGRALVGLGVAVGVTVLGTLGVTLVAESAGAVTRRLVDPSTGVRPKGLSRAEALQAQGDHDGAVAELEAAVARIPDDPEAYLMLARLYRDGRRDLESAALWFRNARERAHLHQGLERLVYRELIEVLRLLDEPRAAPELARMAERFAGTPDEAWARQELAEIKDRMRTEG